MRVDGSGQVQWATDQPRSKTGAKNHARRKADSLGNVFQTGRESERAIITKHTGEGVLQWRREWHGTGDESGNSVTVDASGNAYVVGHFSERLTVGGTKLSSSGTCSTFVTKLSSAGDVMWSVPVTGTGKVAGYSIAVDDMGMILIAGVFEGTLMYGSQEIESAGGQDVFVMKLDGLGEILWGIGVGGAGQDSGNSVVLDKYGDIYVTGSFSGMASFGGILLESQGDLDVFWMKLGSSSAQS